MQPHGRKTKDLKFSSLPEHDRPPQSPLGENPEISGSEKVVGLGGLCDFYYLPTAGDRTVHFRIHEYCQLENGQKAELRDLGFSLSTALYKGNQHSNPHPTEGLTIEYLTDEVLRWTSPEVGTDGRVWEDHDWDELALFARDIGLKVTGEELSALGYSITFTERVKQQIRQS